jgi:hypothetical protein
LEENVSSSINNILIILLDEWNNQIYLQHFLLCLRYEPGSLCISCLGFPKSFLSGCIDIIVVEQPNGQLKSTPFHLRFGKFKALRGKDTSITIFINDKETPLSMKLGRAGEGYFDLSAFQEPKETKEA